MALFRIQRASVSTLEAIQPVHAVVPTWPVTPQPMGLAIDTTGEPAAAERRRQPDRRKQQRRTRNLACLIDTRSQHERRQQRRRQDDPPPGGIDQSI